MKGDQKKEYAMTYEKDPAEPTNPAELMPAPEPILSIGSQQWYPKTIIGCHQVIRGLAADLAGQVQETERLRKELAYFTQTR